MTDSANRFAFTDPRLRGLPTAKPGKRDTYYDEKISELCMRVTDKGSKSFVIYMKHKGVPKRLTLGTFPKMSVDDARSAVRRKLGALAQGVNIFAEAEAARIEPTLGELFDEYIKRHASKKRKTWMVMQKDFDRNLGHWSKKRFGEITPDDIERLHGNLAKERGQYTANRTIQMLRAVFNKGITWKLIGGDNPAKGITLFPERSRERFLSGDEVKNLLANLGKLSPGDDTHDFIMLCLLTGARKSNVLSMRWQDVDQQIGVWTIEETKNGSSQTIPLTGAEIALLEQRKNVLQAKYKKLPDFVFPSNSRTGHVIDLKRSWDALRRNAGIPDCTIHDLRRNLGSWMASENVNVALIRNALHHKDMKTTIAVYARTAKDAVRQGRQVAHTAMLEAAGLNQPEKANVVAIKTAY